MENINYANNEGNVQKNADNILNGMPQENADSIAGAIQTPGYVGGFFGTENQGQQVDQTSTYVGGFIDANQVQAPTQDYNSYENVGYQEDAGKNLPVKRGFWSKVKSFLFEREVTIELTKKEERVLTEIHDFLFQDISFKGFMNILKIGKDKNNK